MAKRKPNGRNIGAAQELKNLVERIVAVEIERNQADAEFKSHIADLYTEAESNGYDKRALKLAVRRRHESVEQRAKRHETEALADLYAAAIGDLGGKPLDDLTRRRLDEQSPHAAGATGADNAQDELLAEGTEPSAPAETAEAAKERGKQARKDGQRVVDNPYHSASPLRAAWDEGWCEADGSDGMEIPAAWRRAKKPEDEEKNEGEDDAAGDGAPPGAAEEQQGQTAQ